MKIDSLAQQRRVSASGGLFACLLGTATLIGGVVSAPSIVFADGGLETQKGGLFHRKGWISPAIYRKDPSRVKKYSSAVRSNLGGPAARAKSQTRQDGARQPNTTARGKRRIPSRVVRRSERSVSRSAQLRQSRKPVRVASLGKALDLPRAAEKKRTANITGGGGRVQWVASRGCVPGRLRAAINHVALNYGRVRVNSTCRSRRQNRRVGGAGQSWHLKGQAADLRVFGNIRGAARYLRSVVGGYKHYGGGLFHIDTGPRRTW